MRKANTPQLAGVIGFFDDPDSLLEATGKVRDARYESFDVFTPFPIHGLEHAQGLKRSPLPYVTMVAGLTGFICAFALQYWTSVIDWPLIVGGKPFNSWPAFVPILFELTVLFAGLATVGAMFFLNGLPNLNKRAFDPSLTCDRFAVVIDAPPPPSESFDQESDEDEKQAIQADRRTQGFKAFSESEASEFLKKLGAKEVRSVYSEGWF